MKTKQDWFVGFWQTAEEDSRAVIHIAKTPQGIRVRAFDKEDKEEFVVSKVRFRANRLSFETYVPSTKYRTKNRLTLVSKNRLVQELTFWEEWKRLARPHRISQAGERTT